MAGCEPELPCSLAREDRCEFAQPSTWVAVSTMDGDTAFGEPGSKTKLIAFPTKYAGAVEPVRISDGAFDETLVLSWYQGWSPDGAMFVFDATSAHFNGEPEARAAMFVSDFGAGVPGLARPVEGLPVGPATVIDYWNADSSAFTVRSAPAVQVFQTLFGELYLVRREGGVLTPSLIAPMSEGVWDSMPCRGGDHVMYLSGDDEFAVRSASGVDAYRANGGFYDALLSADSKWIVLTTLDAEERYSTRLLPCGAGESMALFSETDIPAATTFSDHSRYLTLVDPEEVPTYLELSNPSTRLSFPAGVTGFYSWSIDETFALVGNEAGDMLAFWPATGETTLVYTQEQGYYHHWGDLLGFEETNDDGDIVSIEVLHPRDPERVLARASASDGWWISTQDIDMATSRFAYLEENGEDARVVVLDLADGSELRRFEFPGVFGFSLEALAPDGSGILVREDSSQVSLHFLPLSGPEREPVLIARGAFADLAGVQGLP